MNRLKDIKINSSWILHNKYKNKNRESWLLLVTIAYEFGKINRESYKGQLKSLKEGLIFNPKKSYHCKLNNSWYNDESMSCIINDIANDFKNLELDAETLVKSIMFYTNRNYNYAINFLYTQYLLGTEVSFRYDDYLYIYGVDLPFPIRIHTNSDRCCCCGCSNEYLDDTRTIDEYEDTLAKFLQAQKKGDLGKIPNITDAIYW